MAEKIATVGNFSSSDVTEIRIPVPWGHIAAKTWGSSTCHPVLCLHGELDNAASFDRLVPLLPRKQFHYVCLDLPGHGRSSQFSSGIPYKFLDYLGLLKRVVDYFDWEKIHILGHDLGGLLGLFFAACYPDKVEKLILLDAIHPVKSRQHLVHNIKSSIETLFSDDGKTSPDIHSYQALYEKLLSWRGKDSSVAAIDACIARNADQISDGNYSLTLDPRVRHINYPVLDDQQLQIILKNLKCELLILTARETAKSPRILPVTSLLYIFRYKCARFEHHIVEGNYDLHLNFPGRLAPAVSSFLLHFKSAL